MKYRLTPINNQSVKPEDPSDTKPTKLTNIQIEKEYSKVKCWLESHESKTGTRNMFDILGRPYDPHEYESKLRQLEALYDEGRRRELVFFMSVEEIQEIFSVTSSLEEKNR